MRETIYEIRSAATACVPNFLENEIVDKNPLPIECP
jgi:hypothetical protein